MGGGVGVERENYYRRTGHCGVLAIATWAAWFWAAQGRLLTKEKDERKGQKGHFNIFARAGLRTQSAPENYPSPLWPCLIIFNMQLYIQNVHLRDLLIRYSNAG